VARKENSSLRRLLLLTLLPAAAILGVVTKKLACVVGGKGVD